MDNNTSGLDFSKYLRVKYILTFSSINYLQSGISLLVSLIIANQLGREEFGYFSYGMIFTTTLSLIMQFGTERTLVKDLVQLKKPDITISSAAWLWLVLGVVILTSVSIWTFFISALSYKSAIIILIFSTLGFVRGMSPMAWFDFKGKANYHSVIILIDRLLFLTLCVSIIFFFKNAQAILYIALAQLISRIITLTIEWKYVSGTTNLIKKPVYSFIKKIIGENVWIWLAAMGNLLMTQANQLILHNKFGPKELALYGFSFQVIIIIRLLQQQILRLVTPSIALATQNVQNNPLGVRKKLYKFCGLNILSTLAILLPTYFLAPYVISHFINKDFLGTLPVLNILYIWVTLLGVAIIISQFLVGLKLQRFFFIGTTIFGLLSILLAYAFVNKYGATGAAISLLISHFCSIIFQLWIVLKKINKEANAKIITQSSYILP
jgi:O-antigen/teichoic acid export membrane protein